MSDQDLPDAICDYIGIIRDEEIRSALQRGFLIEQGTFDLGRVRQASYELRLGDTVERLVLDHSVGGSTAIARYERPANGIEDILRIDPGQTIKVFTREMLDMPKNVLAHVIPVGNVYKLGLSPETTYADPGFDGAFYITLCHYSSRIVELKVDQPIARIEFVKLARSTVRPHAGARSVGEPPLWPRRVARRSEADLRAIGIDDLLAELENCDPPHIEHAFVVKEIRSKIDHTLKDVLASESRNKKEIAELRLFALVAIVSLAVWALSHTWPLLPEKLRDMATERIFTGILTSIGVVAVAVSKKGRALFRVALGLKA
jgi:deoxycytidine triphosphate deaminase